MAKKRKKRKDPTGIAQSPFYDQVTKPVAPDVFKACLHVYQAAARMTMPVRNPEEMKISISGNVYAFKDISTNRGMFAIKDFLGKDQAPLFPAVSARIMAFLAACSLGLRTDQRFQQFFRPDVEDTSFLISEALLEAFALAPFVAESLDVDLESVLRTATQRHAEDESSGQ